jgi:hypothetical protein
MTSSGTIAILIDNLFGAWNSCLCYKNVMLDSQIKAVFMPDMVGVNTCL